LLWRLAVLLPLHQDNLLLVLAPADRHQATLLISRWLHFTRRSDSRWV